MLELDILRDLKSISLSSLDRNVKTSMKKDVGDTESNWKKHKVRNTLSNKFMCMHIFQYANKKKRQTRKAHTVDSKLGGFR